MGKMKEKFMEINYPLEDLNFDSEREYLIDEIIAREMQHEEYEKLKRDPEMNLNNHLTTKIEINNGDSNEQRRTRIQISEEEQEYSGDF